MGCACIRSYQMNPKLHHVYILDKAHPNLLFTYVHTPYLKFLNLVDIVLLNALVCGRALTGTAGLRHALVQYRITAVCKPGTGRL